MTITPEQNEAINDLRQRLETLLLAVNNLAAEMGAEPIVLTGAPTAHYAFPPPPPVTVPGLPDRE